MEPVKHLTVNIQKPAVYKHDTSNCHGM